jgi:hypothetical protein
MEVGFATKTRQRAKRRVLGLAVFWAAWVLLLGIANGFGLIDGVIAVNFVP